MTGNSTFQKLVALLVMFSFLSSAGCNRSGPPKSAKSESPQPTQAAGPKTAASVPLTPQYLDELLAPVALYPDVLLIQILTASTTPQEVLDGGNWLLQNTNLKDGQLDDAAKKAGFGPAMLVLVHFPQVVDMMCRQMDWTRQVGEAFKADQKAVLASAQRLRQQAAQAGSLKTTPEQKVETTKENGQTVVTIQPANPQVIYVPQYNPQQVYTPQPQQTTPQQTTEEKSGVSTGTAVAASLLTFGIGMAVGSAISHNDYYYPNWGYGAVYYGPRPYVPAAYAYRPVYTPYYRPATGYVRPANYPYAYDRPYGRNNNVYMQENNYYNRFHNNANIQNNRIGNQTVATQRANNWKGQSTYAGANRSNAGVTTNTARRAGGNSSLPSRTGYAGGNRPNTAIAANTARGASVSPSASVNRERTATSNLANRPAVQTQPRNTSVSSPTNRSFGAADRGFGGGARAGSSSGSSSAFSGGNRASEMAASNRGRASLGGGGGGRRRR